METEDKLNLRLRIGQHTGVFCGCAQSVVSWQLVHVQGHA